MKRKIDGKAREALKLMDQARDFPHNTCPASRHVALAAELLIKHGEYAMLREEPDHVAMSMASTVTSLWKARTKLQELGYEESDGEWKKS